MKLELVNLPLSDNAKDVLHKMNNVTFVKDDDRLFSRGYDSRTEKWVTFEISFAENIEKDECVYINFQKDDETLFALPLTPQMMSYFQVSLANWLSDGNFDFSIMTSDDDD